MIDIDVFFIDESFFFITVNLTLTRDGIECTLLSLCIRTESMPAAPRLVKRALCCNPERRNNEGGHLSVRV